MLGRSVTKLSLVYNIQKQLFYSILLQLILSCSCATRFRKKTSTDALIATYYGYFLPLQLGCPDSSLKAVCENSAIDVKTSPASDEDAHRPS